VNARRRLPWISQTYSRGRRGAGRRARPAALHRAFGWPRVTGRSPASSDDTARSWPDLVGVGEDQWREMLALGLDRRGPAHIAQCPHERRTLRWSKGDSNSWSHPERQRSEGATWVPGCVCAASPILGAGSSSRTRNTPPRLYVSSDRHRPVQIGRVAARPTQSKAHPQSRYSKPGRAYPTASNTQFRRHIGRFRPTFSATQHSRWEWLFLPQSGRSPAFVRTPCH
jgi:hypothetical protein